MEMQSQYVKSFLFGVKFFALILLLLVPPIVGVFVGYQVNALLNVIPITNVKGLEIKSIQMSDKNLEGAELGPYKKNSIIELSTEDKETKKTTYYYVRMNRSFAKDEEQAAEETAIKLLGGYGTDISKAYGYEKSVSYDHLTWLGLIIQVVVVIGLVIGGLAAYFPIFLLFRNLFKRPKSEVA